MATKPTRDQVKARDQFADALLMITQAARLDGRGALDRDDLAAIAARLGRASPAFGLDGIVVAALDRRGDSLGLPSGTAELLTLLESAVRPLDALLLPDDEFRALVDRLQDELGGL